MTADLGTLQQIEKKSGNSSLISEFAFTGRSFSSIEAEKGGLLSRVFPTFEEMFKYGIELASEIIMNARVGVMGTKRALVYAREHGFEDGLRQVAEWNGGMLQSKPLRNVFKSKI